MGRITIAVAMAVALLVPAAGATTYLVRPDGTGRLPDNPGSDQCGGGRRSNSPKNRLHTNDKLRGSSVEEDLSCVL
jgi:hypothetical protein